MYRSVSKEDATIQPPESYVLKCLRDSPVYNMSDYINFTGPPILFESDIFYARIYIDDLKPEYNWSKWASENAWLTGSGTEMDPYVIDHLYIDCQGLGAPIHIRNSEKYFVIKNCWFTNTDDFETSSVYIMWCKNGVIKDNVMIRCTTGVYAMSCENILVENNIIITNNIGGSVDIHLAFVNNCTIKDNKALNVYQGMRVQDCYNMIIDGNYVENRIRKWAEGGTVIYMLNLDDSNVTRNVLAGNFALGNINIQQRDCGNNIIENNYISSDQGLAVDFNISLNSATYEPNISQVTAYSFSLEDCHGNYIAYNIALMIDYNGDGDGNGGGIPGYDLIFIIGIFCMISVIFIIKRRKI